MAQKVSALSVTLLLCFSSFVVLASAHRGNDFLFVEGKVYCDTCRVYFETRLSNFLTGAQVKLECRERNNETVTLTMNGTTDKDGSYSFAVNGEHEEEICEVSLVKSPDSECAEISDEKARVVITKNVGVVDPVRFANPISFMRTQAVANCTQVLNELGLSPEDILNNL
ncbi:hypothetical protein ACFE04_023859 [Oxalis oulophora]